MLKTIAPNTPCEEAHALRAAVPLHGVALLVHLAHRADRHDRGVLEVLFLLLFRSLLGLELRLSKCIEVVQQLVCGLVARLSARSSP